MILILTPYSFNPLHPRLEYIEKYLTKNGYKVKKYNLRCENRVINKLNWLSLTFFQVPSFFKSIKYLWKYRKKAKVIYIQDLQYLPISIIAKVFGKKVIYDTLDNNVELNFYHISNRFKFFKKLTFIKGIIFFLEKQLSKYFCDKIVVNSKALVKYFKPNHAELIYYTSPFENKFQINKNKDIAFLYLGAFSLDKGAKEILDFVERYNYNFFIYGDSSKDILNRIKKLDNIFYHTRISSIELMLELKSLFEQYRLVGFSMIHNVHYSYATQEANKDIDYLAMGIPLIANYREPTKEKVDAGCGVYIDDNENMKKLLNDKLYYKSISKQSIEYYNRFYAQNIFENKLINKIKELGV